MWSAPRPFVGSGRPVYDPRNSLPLVQSGARPDACHELHESGHRRIPRLALTDLNLTYASEVLGERADSYLARFYA